MSAHMVDAFGDLAPVETYRQADGTLLDTFGDPVPGELWEELCEFDDAGICHVCGGAEL
jgi:hypothetical protein